MLANHSLTLLLGQSGECEHTNLGGNMIPGSLGADLLQVLSKGLSHGIYTLGDHDQLVEPLLSHLWLVEDDRGNSGTVKWWGRVVGSDDDFNLGQNLGSNGFIVGDEVEGSSSLTIKSHNLSERLGDDHLESLVEEVSQALTILI